MYSCARGIGVRLFLRFCFIGFRNCSDSMIFFVFHFIVSKSLLEVVEIAIFSHLLVAIRVLVHRTGMIIECFVREFFFPSNQDRRHCREYACSNHCHSVKKKSYSSVKPRDFDRMLGTGLPVSMYTTKTPIDKWLFNVTHVKEFFLFSVKDRYQL